MATLERLYTAKELHELRMLPYCERVIMNLAREEKLGCIQMGRKRRFTEKHVADFIAERERSKRAKPSRSPKYASATK